MVTAPLPFVRMNESIIAPLLMLIFFKSGIVVLILKQISGQEEIHH